MMHRAILVLLILAVGGCGEPRQDSTDTTAAKATSTEATTSTDATTSTAVTPTTTATAEPIGRILRLGIFTKVSGGEVVENPKTSTGKSLSNLVMTFIRETDRIPIKRNIILGYQYRLSNLPDGGTVTLRRVLKHPPFTLPDGSVNTGSDFAITRRVERNEVFGYDIYALNEDYEMVEGDWLFQIWYQDKLLVEQHFTTYREEAPAAAQQPDEPTQ